MVSDVNLHPYNADRYNREAEIIDDDEMKMYGRDAPQPALVIGRHYTTERDSAPVQYNGVV